MAKKATGTPATVALTRAGIGFTLHAYEHVESGHGSGPGYGYEAAAALGVDPAMIFKTLLADLGAELVCAVVPVAGHLDLKALAATLGAKKAIMADPARAARSTGYVLGGISPVGQRSRLRTVIDISATEHELIMVSAGRRGLQVRLSPIDLITITGATTAGIATA